MLDSWLASCPLRTFIVFHRISWIFIDFYIEFYRFSWIADMLGLLGLQGLLEGVFCFLALLGGGLNHGVSHARRSDRSVVSSVHKHRIFKVVKHFLLKPYGAIVLPTHPQWFMAYLRSRSNEFQVVLIRPNVRTNIRNKSSGTDERGTGRPGGRERVLREGGVSARVLAINARTPAHPHQPKRLEPKWLRAGG